MASWPRAPVCDFDAMSDCSRMSADSVLLGECAPLDLPATFERVDELSPKTERGEALPATFEPVNGAHQGWGSRDGGCLLYTSDAADE